MSKAFVSVWSETLWVRASFEIAAVCYGGYFHFFVDKREIMCYNDHATHFNMALNREYYAKNVFSPLLASSKKCVATLRESFFVRLSRDARFYF